MTTLRNVSTGRRFKQIVTPQGQLLEIPPDDNLERVVLPETVDPYATSATQEFPLGTKLSCWGGQEVYRYALEGGVGLEIGALVQSVVPLAGHINEVVGTAAIGATQIAFTPNTVTTDDLAVNALAGGYIYIYNSTGLGAKYRIKSHPAITGGTSGVLTLYDPIRVATLTGASVATVMHNPYRKFLIHPSPPTAMPVGWTVSAVAANYYCWIQVRGPCCALIDHTVVMGQPCTPSAEDDGAVQLYDPDLATEANAGNVGWIMEIGADAAGGAATFGFVFAMLG